MNEWPQNPLNNKSSKSKKLNITTEYITKQIKFVFGRKISQRCTYR